MLLVDTGIVSFRQLQCVPTTYGNSINDFFHYKLFSQTSHLLFLFQCNEYVEMNKFMRSLACTWMTIIECQFYIIDSLSLNVA